MIVEWFLAVAKAVVTGVLSVIPSVSVPSWLSGRNSTLSNVLGYFTGFGAWIPLNLAGAVIGSLLVLVGVSFTVKVVRIVLSYVTAGGGSAG